MGVTFLGERDPDDFSTFCRAFVSMFRITIGRCLSATQLTDSDCFLIFLPFSSCLFVLCKPASASLAAPSPPCQLSLPRLANSSWGLGPPHAAAFHCTVPHMRWESATRLPACDVCTKRPSQGPLGGIAFCVIDSETPEGLAVGVVAYTHARICARARTHTSARACALKRPHKPQRRTRICTCVRLNVIRT